ncbi:MAG: hypothetical protein HY319_03065 [Armatimonadetes bacterium]|nr:hypothetical protein [Armatimonadota bacterium]
MDKELSSMLLGSSVYTGEIAAENEEHDFRESVGQNAPPRVLADFLDLVEGYRRGEVAREEYLGRLRRFESKAEAAAERAERVPIGPDDAARDYRRLMVDALDGFAEAARMARVAAGGDGERLQEAIDQARRASELLAGLVEAPPGKSKVDSS